MRLDHLLSTENIILVPGMVSRGSSLRVPGVLAWKDRCASFSGGGYGHAVGFPGRHGLLVWGLAFGCPPWVPSRVFRVGVCGVAWWFENWRVDASGPRGRPCGVAGRGLLVLMYFDRVPFVGGLVVCLIVL